MAIFPQIKIQYSIWKIRLVLICLDQIYIRYTGSKKEKERKKGGEKEVGLHRESKNEELSLIIFFLMERLQG